MNPHRSDMTQPSLPWWRVPAAWLLVGGPAAVVVAGVITTVIAVRGGDVPVNRLPAPKADAHTPATQARNHAAAPRR